MATLVRDLERPSCLDRPPERQLAFGVTGAPTPVSAPPREAQPTREPLSGRLRTERSTETVVLEAERPRTAVARIVAARGGGATLDEMLVGAWEGLSARRPVACPICAEPMRPNEGATGGGSCQSCGSRLC